MRSSEKRMIGIGSVGSWWGRLETTWWTCVRFKKRGGGRSRKDAREEEWRRRVLSMNRG